jgi:plasmid stability protein
VNNSEWTERHRGDIVDIKCEVVMADLLIRDIEAPLKQRLEESARKNNRSLSDEVKLLLQRALATGTDDRKLGTLMRRSLPPESRSDDYVFEVPGEVSRPPDFE